jgi:hypothetical protein
MSSPADSASREIGEQSEISDHPLSLSSYKTIQKHFQEQKCEPRALVSQSPNAMELNTARISLLTKGNEQAFVIRAEAVRPIIRDVSENLSFMLHDYAVAVKIACSPRSLDLV